MLIPSFGSRRIQRLGESSGIGQPGLSHPPAPDGVGKTSLCFDIPSAVQAPAAGRAPLVRQRLPVRYWQLCFCHVFNEASWHLGMQLLTSRSSSKPVAPL